MTGREAVAVAGGIVLGMVAGALVMAALFYVGLNDLVRALFR